LDVFETFAKILSVATNGASHTRIMTLHQQLSQDEIRWLLKSLVDKNLLELDSSATYWTTVNGVKFLEIQFHMERMLQVQKSLV
jgi:predicted transcriptional regulator